MNDFTKEELELIAECVESDFYHTNWSRSMYDPLMLKLQSMIENYCDHDGKIGKDYPGEKCMKCNRMWE